MLPLILNDNIEVATFWLKNSMHICTLKTTHNDFLNPIKSNE